MADVNGWTADDYAALVAMANHQGAPPDWFAAIMLSESGLNPAAENSIGCRGLIGFCFGAPPRGTNPAEQMPYVNQYYQGWRPAGGWISRAQLYQSGYVPDTIRKLGSAPGTVLTRKGDGLYDGNEPLDPDNKGFITVNDLDRRLDHVTAANPRQWAAAQAGIVAAGGTLSTSAARAPSHATMLFGGLALGAFGAYVYLNRRLLPPLPGIRRYA
jgi:hypothetical protein